MLDVGTNNEGLLNDPLYVVSDLTSLREPTADLYLGRAGHIDALTARTTMRSWKSMLRLPSAHAKALSDHNAAGSCNSYASTIHTVFSTSKISA